MKTTITLDDDIADFLKEQCRLQDKPFEQVVNETLRRGMARGSHKPEQTYVEVVPTMGGFAPGFDPEKIKEFLEEEDIQRYFRVAKYGTCLELRSNSDLG